MTIARLRFLGASVAIGLLLAGPGALSRARGQAPRSQPAQGKSEQGADLATRYRLHEQFSSADKPLTEGSITAYRVAFRKRLTSSVDNPRGAPKITERSTRAIYQERPADVSSIDDRMVTATVRKYESAQFNPEPTLRPGEPKLFHNLAVWYQPRSDDPPQVLVLTPNRKLDAREYLLVSREVYVPNLALALPDLPLHVGDTYKIGRLGIDALMAAPVLQGEMTGKLVEVKADPSATKGSGQIAVLDLSGKVSTSLGDGSVHAQIRFAFTPLAGDDSPGTPLDSPGRVVRFSLAQEMIGSVPGEHKLTQRVRQEIVLECRPIEDAAAIALPPQAPKPTPENSWLTYMDPQGRFSFAFPQEFQSGRNPANHDNADILDLVHARSGGPDVISISLKPQAELAPDTLVKGVEAAWKEEGVKVVMGKAGWLPDADWPGKRVYRFEAVLTEADAKGGGGGPTAGSPRKHFDGYVIKTGLDRGLYIEATTVQDAPGPFRDQIEALIKSFQFSGAVGTNPPPAPVTTAAPRAPRP